jgi:hypothetical protein
MPPNKSAPSGATSAGRGSSRETACSATPTQCVTGCQVQRNDLATLTRLTCERACSMSDEIIVREAAVDVPGAGRFLRREYLAPQGESIQVEYLLMPAAAVA